SLSFSDFLLQPLEEQLQAELDVTRAARAEHGVIPLNIRRGARTTELARCARIQSPRVRGGNCEVGAVKYVKELHPELRRVPFFKFPLLADRKIDVVVVRYAEDVPAGITYSSQSRGRQKPAALCVTAIIRQCGVGQRRELGIAGIRSLGGSFARSRGAPQELRNGLRTGFKCRARSAVIPGLQRAGDSPDEFPSSDYVVCD